MSTEDLALRTLELLSRDGLEVGWDEPTEDIISGGHFFDLTVAGRHFEVLVREVGPND